MSIFSVLAIAVLAAAAATMAAAETPDLGRTPSAEEIAAWDIAIGPHGTGLPPGGGTAEQGAVVFEGTCAGCHGDGGEGGIHDRLVGGVGSLVTDAPVKTVGSYWPYAPTVFDYIRRAMPFTAPMSLTDDEVYAVTAYLLHRNGLIGATEEMNADTLPAVAMPNRDGFVPWYPPLRE